MTKLSGFLISRQFQVASRFSESFAISYSDVFAYDVPMFDSDFIKCALHLYPVSMYEPRTEALRSEVRIIIRFDM
jgi:hypothetical protein